MISLNRYRNYIDVVVNPGFAPDLPGQAKGRHGALATAAIGGVAMNLD
ncbi:MAG TPA: hypothetical protein VIN75_07725 [Burkholderiaceae bacterium]